MGAGKEAGDRLGQFILEDGQVVAVLIWGASAWHLGLSPHHSREHRAPRRPQRHPHTPRMDPPQIEERKTHKAGDLEIKTHDRYFLSSYPEEKAREIAKQARTHPLVGGK